MSALRLDSDGRYTAWTMVEGIDYKYNDRFRVEGDNLYLGKTDIQASAFGWEGELLFRIQDDGDLVLDSESNFGVLISSQALMPIIQEKSASEYIVGLP